MQFSPLSCHFIPLQSKYSQHPVLKHPKTVLPPLCQYYMAGWLWIVIWKGVVVSQSRYYHIVHLQGLGKTWKLSGRTGAIPSEIQIKHLQNACLRELIKPYCLVFCVNNEQERNGKYAAQWHKTTF
jgi:hypothetical protein